MRANRIPLRCIRYLHSAFARFLSSRITIARLAPGWYRLVMKLQELEQEARSLPECDRADLVLSLMDTLGDPGDDISDEEVCQREAELEAGEAEPMLHEEFVRRVRDERGR